MTEHVAVVGFEGNAEVGLDAVFARSVLRLNTTGNETVPARDHILTGCPAELVLHVCDKPAIRPDRQGPQELSALEGGYEAVVLMDRRPPRATLFPYTALSPWR